MGVRRVIAYNRAGTIPCKHWRIVGSSVRAGLSQPFYFLGRRASANVQLKRSRARSSFITDGRVLEGVVGQGTALGEVFEQPQYVALGSGGSVVVLALWTTFFIVMAFWTFRRQDLEYQGG